MCRVKLWALHYRALDYTLTAFLLAHRPDRDRLFAFGEVVAVPAQSLMCMNRRPTINHNMVLGNCNGSAARGVDLPEEMFTLRQLQMSAPGATPQSVGYSALTIQAITIWAITI